ncbi:MAG: MOSC domain-containing protein [Burkholderiales bacterium]
MSASMRVVGVQVGSARKLAVGERTVLSAIHKTAVAGAVEVTALGLAGDEQVDLSVHGGLEKAVYAYPSEHYAFWQAARHEAGVPASDTAQPCGAIGENLTLRGLLETQVWVGDVLQFANCRLRVTQPREPCYKFNATMGMNSASKRMAQSGFCGFYLAVEQAGHLQAGEIFELVPGPRRVSIVERFAAKMQKHLR